MKVNDCVIEQLFLFTTIYQFKQFNVAFYNFILMIKSRLCKVL